MHSTLPIEAHKVSYLLLSYFREKECVNKIILNNEALFVEICIYLNAT